MMNVAMFQPTWSTKSVQPPLRVGGRRAAVTNYASTSTYPNSINPKRLTPFTTNMLHTHILHTYCTHILHACTITVARPEPAPYLGARPTASSPCIGSGSLNSGGELPCKTYKDTPSLHIATCG
jgi:hypothetical protein